MTNDIIIDTLDTLIGVLVKAGAQVLPTHRSEAERIVRAAWAGERPYIAKLGESGQVEMSRRNQAIRRDHARGAHVQLLARRYGLSVRTVQVIVQPDRAAPCLTGCADAVHPTADRQPGAKRLPRPAGPKRVD